MAHHPPPGPGRLHQPHALSSAAYFGSSIGPASTPDVFAHPPPLQSDDLTTALLRGRARQRKAWQGGEWAENELGKAVEGVGPVLGGGGSWGAEAGREGVGEDEEEEGEGIEWVGWMMLVGSVTAWVVGVWSMFVGPFVETQGGWVSAAVTALYHSWALLKLTTALAHRFNLTAPRRPGQRYALQVPPRVCRPGYSLRGHHQLVGAQGQSAHAAASAPLLPGRPR